MAGEQATESIRSDLAISGELARAVLYNNPQDAANALKAAGLFFIPTGALFPFAGATSPTGYLLCNGSAISRSTYAALFAAIGTTYGAGDGSTTFNIPNLSGRTPVGAGTGAQQGVSGNGVITGGTALTVRALGDFFGDERTQSHSHGSTGLATGTFDARHTHAHALTIPGHTHNTTANGFRYVQVATGTTYNVHQIASGSSANRDTGYETGGVTGTNPAIDGTITAASNNNATPALSLNHSHDVTGNTDLYPTSTATRGLQQNLQPSVVTNYIIKT